MNAWAKGPRARLRAWAAALFVSAAWAFGAAAAEYANPNGVALIVGNRDYEHGDVFPVDFAHRDAEAFRRYVLDVLGFDPRNVVLMKDATKTELFDALGARGAAMSDVQARVNLLDAPGGADVVFFYSGHGVPGDGGAASLLPKDAPPHRAAADSYPIALLLERLGELRGARSVRVFLDACYSGSSHAGRLIAASPVFVEPEMPSDAPAGMTVLTAVTGAQIATWDEDAGHGLFTHHLLDALYGKGDKDNDGTVTLAEAKKYLDQHMTAAAWLLNKREQTADLNTGDPADTVLASAEGGSFPARPVLDASADSAAAAPAPAAARPPAAAPAPPAAPDPAAAEAALGLDRASRALVQRGLVSLAFDPGPVDGAFGPRTRSALGAWQTAKGYEATGRLTREQAETLMAMGREAESADRAERERREREAAEARAERERLAREAAEAAERERVARADDDAFARAKRENTASAYASYLSGWPTGRHVADARRLRDAAVERERLARADDDAFAAARQADTASAYASYLSGWPSGRHAAEARRLRDAAAAPLDVGDVFRDCAECPEMVVLPSGSFDMGSPSSEERRFDNEGPVHRVRIGYRLAVGKYEVTFAEWDACVDAGGCGRDPDDAGWGRGSRPVIFVSWEDAQEYVAWLNVRSGLSGSGAYRLLSESEWEYAARAGTRTARYWGSGIGRNNANCDGCGSRWDDRQTAPVGSFQANGWGLYDMLGNVWEWTRDCWNGSYAGAPSDGSAWETGNCSRRVLRGGSWLNGPWDLRAAFRVWSVSGIRFILFGFRVARTLTP